METVEVLAWALVASLAALAACILAIGGLRRRLATVTDAMDALDASKRSQSTRYGQITEQFAPFMASWPWDPKRFKFLGDPIDGVQFNDDGIVFVEIKTATSRLSPVQRQVRDHVLAGRVRWHEQRLS